MLSLQSHENCHVWRGRCWTFPFISLELFCFSKSETSKGVPEWAIVELQGLIQMKNENLTEPIIVGDLLYYDKNRQPVLILGHHVLSGKETKLEQPMAVFEKVVTNEKTEYKVKAIVKKQLLFKYRPKPIICNVNDK